MHTFFRPTEYLKPKTVAGALTFLVKFGNESKIIAGGTDLIVDRPPVRALIDITELNLAYIKNSQEGLRIGALTTIRQLEVSQLTRNFANGILADAAHRMASMQIRNIATIGGNICSAVSSADLPPPLLVLDSRVKIATSEQEKVVPLEKFFLDARKTALSLDEMLIEIQIPKFPDHSAARFLKLGRTALDLALVNVAVRITVKDGVCRDSRIALGAVAPTPMRARKAESLLRNERIEMALLDEAAKVASEEARPISDVRASADYRREITRVLVQQALTEAVRQVEG